MEETSPEGAAVIVVLGAVVSTVQEALAGDASVLPAASVARTWIVCEPCERLESARGLVALVHDPLSSFLWKVTPVSFEVKLIVAFVEETSPEGAAVIVVFGAVVSTVQEALAGDASVFPAASVARTWIVWVPCERPVRDNGLVAFVQDPLSSFLWKVTPDSFELKVTEAVVDETLPDGADIIVVFGIVVSTVQEALAGVASVFPAASVART